MKLATLTKSGGPRVAALVHGASASGDIWRDFASVLVDRYDMTVLIVDLRGHGASPHADTYDIQDFTEDLVETLPVGLDYLIGQSLGGWASANAVGRLAPKRFIGIDPALDIRGKERILLPLVGPFQPHLPTWVLRQLGSPPKGAAPDTLARFRVAWKTWDPRMMRQLARSASTHPFVVTAPKAPSTIVLADPSFAVSEAMVTELIAAGWDVRVKPGGVHELHVQDPEGLAAMLDDVLRASN